MQPKAAIMKITVEISHFAEVRELIVALDRHRIGAVILLVAVPVVVASAVVAWNAFR